MKHTFKCDEGMLITIPLGSLKEGHQGELMPAQFHCVFRDVYKVFITKGKPTRVGAAQAIIGILMLSLAVSYQNPYTAIQACWNIPFMITGMLTIATGLSPNMCVAKLSFTCNIFSFCWSLAGVVLCSLRFEEKNYLNLFINNVKLFNGINGLMVVFLGVEVLLTSFMMYWFSQCVCRQHFNTLPVIKLQA